MAKSLSRLFVILLIPAFFGGGLYGQTIRIPERVEVDSDSLVLGDLAPGLPEKLHRVPVGYSPYPGHYRWLSRGELAGYLRKWGLENEARLEMPQRVLITRMSRPVERDLIRKAVENYLRDAFPGFEVTIQKLDLPQDVILPLGSVEVRVTSARRLQRLDGVSLKLDFLSDSIRRKSQWVKVVASARGKVPVLTTDKGYGETIRESDLIFEWRTLDRVEDVVLNPLEIAGSVAKKNLAEGSLIHRRDIEEPVLVERGDLVTLVARGPKFKISTTVRAKDAGSRGDSITVENLSSRRMIQATVVGTKIVELVLPGSGR